MTWPAAATGEDPARLLPWQLPAPPPHHPAGHAKPQHRQHHPDGTPQRSARRRHQHTGQGPNQRAVQQPGQLGLSQWLPVGAGHERLQRSTRHRAGAALAGRRAVVRTAQQARSAAWVEQPWPCCVRRVTPPPRRRGPHEATTPERTRSSAWALQRHLARRGSRSSYVTRRQTGHIRPGQQHPAPLLSRGGCRLAERSDRRGVGSGRVPGHGPGSPRQPL